jgi:GntR family transcriptional regulator / MocR family aminotransferase
MIWITLDKESHTSLTRQLYEQLKEKILTGQLKAGYCLPPSRKMAEELTISRNVVIFVYEQLLAEGFLYSRTGSGTFVCDGLHLKNYRKTVPVISERNKSTTKKKVIHFPIGVPDKDQFPYLKWNTCLKKASEQTKENFGYTEPKGLHKFRELLAGVLLTRKGIECSPEQIYVTSGTLGGFDSISQIMRKEINEVVVEEPSYDAIYNVFKNNDYNVCEIPVDNKGLQTRLLYKQSKKCPVVITPAHHYPCGCVLTVQRRIELVEYARSNETYIFENDYDSDFRFRGMPVSSIQVLDPEHVFHIGTFSETMYPSLRLGYIVVPPELTDICDNYYNNMQQQVSSLSQLAIMNFISTGGYDKHLLRMNKIYRNKRKFLINSLQDLFNEEVLISGDAAGLYLIAEFKKCTFDNEWIKSLEHKGVRFYSIHEFSPNKSEKFNKLLIGYGNSKYSDIEEGLRILRNETGKIS